VVAESKLAARALFAFGFVAVVGCGTAPLPQCEEKPSKSARTGCYQKEAVQTGNRQLCLLQLKTLAEQSRCIAEFAKAKNDETACDEASRIFPTPNCYVDLANRTQNVALCQRVPDATKADECVSNIAVRLRNAELCSTSRAAANRDRCFSAVAGSAHTPELCNKIDNRARRQDCLASAAMRVDGSKQSCADLADPLQRDACSRRRSASDPSMCDLLSVGKDDCYHRAARSSRPQLCEKVGVGADSAARWRCVQDALNYPPSSCAGISNAELEQQCLARMAEKPGSGDNCSRLSDSQAADDCWATVASQDADYCLRIKQPDARRDCARAAWPKVRDPRLCSELIPVKLQQACAARAALNKR